MTTTDLDSERRVGAGKGEMEEMVGEKVSKMDEKRTKRKGRKNDEGLVRKTSFFGM